MAAEIIFISAAAAAESIFVSAATGTKSGCRFSYRLQNPYRLQKNRLPCTQSFAAGLVRFSHVLFQYYIILVPVSPKPKSSLNQTFDFRTIFLYRVTHAKGFISAVWQNVRPTRDSGTSTSFWHFHSHGLKGIFWACNGIESLLFEHSEKVYVFGRLKKNNFFG